MNDTMYDDNFGVWEHPDEPEVQEMFDKFQKTNVYKICVGCNRKVRIQPNYDVCNNCAILREQGANF